MFTMHRKSHIRKLVLAALMSFFVFTTTSCSEGPNHYYTQGENAGYDDGSAGDSKSFDVVHHKFGDQYTKGYLAGFNEGHADYIEGLKQIAEDDGYDMGEQDAIDRFEPQGQRMCEDEQFPVDCQNGYDAGYFETRHDQDRLNPTQDETPPNGTSKSDPPRCTQAPPEYNVYDEPQCPTPTPVSTIPHTVPPTTAPACPLKDGVPSCGTYVTYQEGFDKGYLDANYGLDNDPSRYDDASYAFQTGYNEGWEKFQRDKAFFNGLPVPVPSQDIVKSSGSTANPGTSGSGDIGG